MCCNICWKVATFCNAHLARPLAPKVLRLILQHDEVGDVLRRFGIQSVTLLHVLLQDVAFCVAILQHAFVSQYGLSQLALFSCGV